MQEKNGKNKKTYFTIMIQMEILVKEWKSAKDVNQGGGWNPDYISLVAKK